MKYRKEVIFFCFLFCQAGAFRAHAQNMNNPYSVYGIGDIDFRAYNRTSGMASTGLALPSSYYIIDNNPAAIAGLVRSFYLVDAAATGKSVQYSGSPISAGNSSNKDFWIKRFGLAVKVNKIWASAFGIRQFSNVNYKFNGTKSIEGSATTYATDNEGDGGLNEYYWTNAVSFGKHFSLGLKSAIIAGPVNHSETLTDETLQSTIATQQQDYYGQAHFQAGALYSTAVNKQWDLSLGGRFEPRIKMIAERTLTVTENATAIVTNDLLKDGVFYLPNTYAGGIALKHNKKATFALDYVYEDWSSLHISDQGWQLISSNRLSAGVEFSKQKRIAGQAYETRFFQLGAFLNNSYLQIRNTPVREFGFTAGMGGAINGSFHYNLALEAGSRGTTKENLIRENYVQLTLGLSFRDFLASKGRKYE
ncbi:MAG: hypothetical protein Q8941_13230 [Bacteroidota bacterium]|nr:hypothetical protein [Bacteroidota bacterium]